MYQSSFKQDNFKYQEKIAITQALTWQQLVLVLQPGYFSVLILQISQTLREELSLEQGQTIWSRATKSSICTHYKENTYKVLILWYMTPSCLLAIYPLALNHCWRCHKDQGTLLHIYWQCPSL